MKINKIIIFTIDGFHSNAAYSKLIEYFKDRELLIVESKRYGGKYGSFLHQLKKNFVNSGHHFVDYLTLHFIYYKIFTYFFYITNKLFLRKPKVLNIRMLAKKYKIPVIRTNEVKEVRVVDKIRNFNPDLIITSNFDQLLSFEIIDMANKLALNIHTSILPRNKGPFPALWSVIHDKEDIGVTIHRLTARFDEGDIAKQVKEKMLPNESVLLLDRRLLGLGGSLIIDVVKDFEEGLLRYTLQDKGGGYYSYPTKQDLHELKKTEVKLFSYIDFFKSFI